jgi:hypothetical protein
MKGVFRPWLGCKKICDYSATVYRISLFEDDRHNLWPRSAAIHHYREIKAGNWGTDAKKPGK